MRSRRPQVKAAYLDDIQAGHAQLRPRDRRFPSRRERCRWHRRCARPRPRRTACPPPAPPAGWAAGPRRAARTNTPRGRTDLAASRTAASPAGPPAAGPPAPAGPSPGWPAPIEVALRGRRRPRLSRRTAGPAAQPITVGPSGLSSGGSRQKVGKGAETTCRKPKSSRPTPGTPGPKRIARRSTGPIPRRVIASRLASGKRGREPHRRPRRRPGLQHTQRQRDHRSPGGQQQPLAQRCARLNLHPPGRQSTSVTSAPVEPRRPCQRLPPAAPRPVGHNRPRSGTCDRRRSSPRRPSAGPARAPRWPRRPRR